MNLDGSLAPPMQNGEVVFEAPWQGRVFGMARALAEAGAYDWEAFRTGLIDEIARWERSPEGEYAYYDCFLRALERVLLDHGLVSAEAFAERIGQFGARPPRHDHDHDHEVGHDHDHEVGHDHDQGGRTPNH